MKPNYNAYYKIVNVTSKFRQLLEYTERLNKIVEIDVVKHKTLKELTDLAHEAEDIRINTSSFLNKFTNNLNEYLADANTLEKVLLAYSINSIISYSKYEQSIDFPPDYDTYKDFLGYDIDAIFGLQDCYKKYIPREYHPNLSIYEIDEASFKLISSHITQFPRIGRILAFRLLKFYLRNFTIAIVSSAYELDLYTTNLYYVDNKEEKNNGSIKSFKLNYEGDGGQFISNLYRGLLELKMLNPITSKGFYNIFRNVQVNKKTTWTGFKSDLAYFIKLLNKYNVIEPTRKIYAITKICFCDINNEDFKTEKFHSDKPTKNKNELDKLFEDNKHLFTPLKK